VFPWPHVKELWVAYLTKFVERYGGSKLERARDLFEQAVDGCPPAEAPSLYRLYASMEERFGLVRHAMAVYDRATRATDDAHRFVICTLNVIPISNMFLVRCALTRIVFCGLPCSYEVFLAYIRKAEEFFGPLRTREIYERAIDVLPENQARCGCGLPSFRSLDMFDVAFFLEQVKDMCLRFAAMEALHGEAERARALYVHASTYCDPRTNVVFWKTWQDFEVEHGNEETFREMLRIKRSVATSFSSANYAVEDLLQQAASSGASSHKASVSSTAIVTAPSTENDANSASIAAPLAGTKRSAAQAQLPTIRAVPIAGNAIGDVVAAVSNPDEIDLDGDADGDDNTAADIEQKQVPAAVFGGLSVDAPLRNQADAAKGALDRFRSRQR
jgi:pre-mRNA-splicing factor SYF1